MTSTTTLPTHPSNTGQLRAWDGAEGAYWAAHPGYFDRVVAGYDDRFLAAAAIGAADHVLDIGCGNGRTTLDAARAATAGHALGVDLSSAMIGNARRLAAEEGLANVRFEQADAQIHPFAGAGFDIAVSRTGAMFFGDPVAAFANIARAIRPGGRLALLTWQPFPRQEWLRELFTALAAGRDLPAPPPGAPGPFSLADPERVRNVLTRAGFTDVELDDVAADVWLGTDAEHASRLQLGLLGWMLEGLDEAGRARAVDALRATLIAHETPDGVLLGSAAWIIRAARP